MNHGATSLRPRTTSVELALLFRTALAYLPGRIIPALVGAVALPSLGWLLTPAEFGTVSIVTAALSYVGIVAGDWIVAGYQRRAHVEDREEEGQATIWVLSISTTSAAFLGVTGALTKQLELVALSLLVVPYLIMRTQWIKLQMTGRPWYYSGIQAAYALVRATAMLGAAAYFHSIGFVLGAWILVGFAIVLCGPRLRVSLVPRLRNLRDLGRVGIPLIAVAISLSLMATADRFIVDWLDGRASAGVYSFGYLIGENILGIPTSVIYLAAFWLATRTWDNGNQNDALRLITTLMRLQVSISVIVVFALIIAAAPIFSAFVPADYQVAAPIVGVVAAAQIPVGISQYLVLVATLHRRSQQTIGPSIMAAFVNLILTVLAVHGFGIIGAAVATLASCVIYCAWLLAVVRPPVLSPKTAVAVLLTVLAGGTAALIDDRAIFALLGAIAMAGLAYILMGSGISLAAKDDQ